MHNGVEVNNRFLALHVGLNSVFQVLEGLVRELCGLVLVLAKEVLPLHWYPMFADEVVLARRHADRLQVRDGLLPPKQITSELQHMHELIRAVHHHQHHVCTEGHEGGW